MKRGQGIKATTTVGVVTLLGITDSAALLIGVVLDDCDAGASVNWLPTKGARVALRSDGAGVITPADALCPSTVSAGDFAANGGTQVATARSGAPATAGALVDAYYGGAGGGASSSGPTVLEFGDEAENKAMTHGRFWGATGAPLALEGDSFFWDGWFRVESPGTGYVLSDGWGGAHAILWCPGFAQSGNIRNGAASTLNFGGDYTANPGEWFHGAVACDGSFVYTFINGVCVGRTAWSGDRYTNGSSSDGFLLVGGPFDHQIFEGAVAWLRGFDVNKFPLTAAGGQVPGFCPERFPSGYFLKAGTEIYADFVADYTKGDAHDTSPSGARLGGVISGGIGQWWHGRPVGGTYYPGAPGAGGPPESSLLLPTFTSDPTCPLTTTGTQPVSGEIARTPTAPAVDDLVFDSFQRANQTFALQLSPSLGSTESGTLGPLVWQTGNAVNDPPTNRPESWGILGGYAVMVGANNWPVAWVDSGVADHWVHIDRSLATWASKTTGLCFRLSDEDNFWYVGIQSGTLAQFGKCEAGVLSGTSNRAISATATQLSVRINGTSAQLYQDGVSVGAAFSVAGFNETETNCGMLAPMDGTQVDSLARYGNFRIKAA